MSLSRRQFIAAWRWPAVAPLNLPAEDDPDVHLLNRLSYGVRPDELARLRTLGVAAYLDEQLDPANLADAEADQRLARLPLLNLDRRVLHQIDNADYRVYKTLIEGAVVRATFSRRQLLERMVDFWADHFNIPLGDQNIDLLVFHREALRSHALGNFRDLLVATAQSPAMLVYLDNYVNVAEHPNQNYARELLELHTLGVDADYSEDDVRAVARAFTGWTLRDGSATGFFFDHEEHDPFPKRILGASLGSDLGLADGLYVLNMLARHPATIDHVCTKLCRRFVSDEPPASLVARLADVWVATDGALAPILRALFLSDEFQRATGVKFRRPFDFFVGALRATETEILDFYVLEEMLLQLDQLPYNWRPPNGYPDVAAAWQSANGLLMRWNAAMRLTHGAHSDPDNLGEGLTTNLRRRLGAVETVDDLVDGVATLIFGRPLAGLEAAPFVDYAADGAGGTTAVTNRRLSRKLASLYGLMLASPQFMWR